jgi:hypothetical protein
MVYTEFRRHLGKAGLTVNDFAGIVQVRPSSVSNYSKKREVPQTYAVLAVLMGDAKDRGVDFGAVLSKFSVSTRAPIVNVADLSEFRKRPKR